MVKKALFFILVFIVAVFYLTAAAVAAPVKMAIFNFQTNMEASGQGTAVTNMLLTALKAERRIEILDRKDLEAFLTLNDLQQNDNLDNVINIGARLGLNMITVGSVEKKGTLLLINCRVIGIEQKRVIFSKPIRSLGDARLGSEIADLGKAIVSTVTSVYSQDDGQAAIPVPVNIVVRPGNKQIQMSWKTPANSVAVTYEIFRATSHSGPYAKVSQVTVPEYVDQNLEKNVLYYYKLRAYSERGVQGEFSEIFYAETVLTPNPPVILKAESHVQSIRITWTPNPMSSGDPLRLMGYKIYRSKVEQGPYREVANILGKDLGIGVDTATTLDRLFKVDFMDKGLADGETVYYKITAYNEKNLESDYSSPIRGLTISSVTNIYAQGDMVREVRLSWTTLEGTEIKGYNVYRSTVENDGFKKIAVLDQPSSGEKKLQYKDTAGLGDTVRYYYRITAFENPAGETASKVTVSAITKGKPAVPQDVRASGGLVKKIEISWTPSNTEDVEGYKLYAARQSEGEFLLIKKLEGRNISKFVDDDRTRLDDNVTSYYRLTAYNKVDIESSSAPASAATKPRPSRPLGLKGEELKLKEAPLSWGANPENDVSTYHLWRVSSEGGEFKHIAKIAARTAHVDKDLQDGVTYSYKLQAEDRDGLISEFSEAVKLRTKPRPQSPTGFSVEIRAGKANLKWNRGSETDIAYYRVYEKKFFGNEKIADVKDTNFSETSPPKGKTKTYLITAVDADELESNPSQEISVTGR